MAEVIDSFLISLGFDVDDDSVKKSGSAISGIKTGAIAMGAALSAALVGAGLVAKRTAKDIGEVYDSSKLLGSVGVSQLDAYRHAFVQAGGSIEDAEATLSSFESLLAKAKLGEGPFEDLAKAGIPPELLTDTRTSIELFEKLASIYPQLSDEQKKLAQSALGVSRGADLLLREGPEQVQQWLADAQRLGVISEEISKSAENLNRSSNNLSRAFDNIKNLFTGAVADDLADVNNGFADTLVQVSEVMQGKKAIGESGPEKVVRAVTSRALNHFMSPFKEFSDSLGEGAPRTTPPVVSPQQLISPSLQTFRDRVIENRSSSESHTTVIEKVEIRVDGSKSPGATAKEVMKEINKQAAIAERGMRTGLLG